MLPLLLPFLLDTVIAPPMDYEDLFVNEWGIVVFNSTGADVASSPDENGNVPFVLEPFQRELMVDAPVIWIHGAYFEDATLTVKAVQGSLTTIFPAPDASFGQDSLMAVSWDIAANPPVTRRERPELIIPQGTPFGWAMGFWRDVPSLDLYSAETDDYMANFLYYEMRIPVWETPDGISDAKVFAGYYSPEGLLITTGDEPTVERIQLIPLPDGSGSPPGQIGNLSSEDIDEVICGWAAGNLKSEEISAIWQTWKPFFNRSNLPASEDESIQDRLGTEEKWILFPLPWDVVEEISTINLDVHDSVNRQITYNRLFLGLVRIY